MKKIVFLLIIAVGFSSCASKFAKVLKSKDYEYKYKKAEQYYVLKKYNYAQQLFDDLFPYLKGTQRFEDMYYKYAYTFYYQKDFLNAENLFKSFVEMFPTSTKAEECEYMRAYCFYQQIPKVELDQTPTNKTMSLMQAFINAHPGSSKVKEANYIIDQCREKLELKEFKSAQLYYNLGYFKAAAIAFASVLDNYPYSDKADEYKLLVIKSYFRYAEMSVEDKQKERYEQVINECTDFLDRFPNSQLKDEVSKYKTQSDNFLKTK